MIRGSNTSILAYFKHNVRIECLKFKYRFFTADCNFNFISLNQQNITLAKEFSQHMFYKVAKDVRCDLGCADVKNSILFMSIENTLCPIFTCRENL